MALSAANRAKLMDIERERLRVRASDGSLIAFTLFTKPDYKTNWHHRLLCKKLRAFARGDIKRLIVSMPPRYGKSELVSRRLPALIFGLNPDASVIAASYAADLASRMNRDVQRIIDSPDYVAIFPKTRIGGRAQAGHGFIRNSSIFEINGHRGVYRSAGVGGGITGMGANFLIIDDPIKNEEEAQSPVYRQRIWDWYTSTLYTRREKDAGILITMTRWHEDDLVGRLLDAEKSEWDVVEFPAIKDTLDNPEDPRGLGDALWPEKYGLVDLQKTKTIVGSRVWNSLYQQKPTSPEGAIIQRKWTRNFWRQLPSKFDEIIQSWDMAFKEGKATDYVVGQVWGKKGAELYLIDQVRARMGFTDTLASVRQVSWRYPLAHVKLVEDKANGPAILDTLKKEIAGMIPVEPQGSKIARMNAAAPAWEAGNVFIPHPSVHPWVLDFIEELVNFPNAANDDQCDSMTQALIRFRGAASGQFPKEIAQDRIKTHAPSLRGDSQW